jgi:hypothetical protein
MLTRERMGNKNHETYGSLGAYALKAAGGTKTHKVYGNVELNFHQRMQGGQKV